VHHDRKDGILGAGVCQLGKIGAWIILACIFFTTLVLLQAKRNYTKTTCKSKATDDLKKLLISIILLFLVLS